jgi:hypothetical protein
LPLYLDPFFLSILNPQLEFFSLNAMAPGCGVLFALWPFALQKFAHE